MVKPTAINGKDKLLDTAIISTNRQICEEALPILYSSWKVNHSNSKGYSPLTEHQLGVVRYMSIGFEVDEPSNSVPCLEADVYSVIKAISITAVSLRSLQIAVRYSEAAAAVARNECFFPGSLKLSAPIQSLVDRLERFELFTYAWHSVGVDIKTIKGKKEIVWRKDHELMVWRERVISKARFSAIVNCERR